MKDIFQALVRTAWAYWDRRRRRRVSIGYLLLVAAVYIFICCVHGRDNAKLRQDNDQLKQKLDGYRRMVLPNDLPRADEGPVEQRPAVAIETHEQIGKMRDEQEASWSAHHPAEKHRGKSYAKLGKELDVAEKKMTLYQLCRANHGTRSQCRAESRWSHNARTGAMIGEPLRVSWPNPPVEEENTDRSEGTAATYRGELGELHLLNLGSDVAGVWTCNRDATAPFGLRCDFRSWAPTGPASSDSSPSHIETHFDDGMLCIACGPLGQGAQPEGVDTLQTTGPMPVKVCGLGGPCKVEDGKWTIDPASDSDGNQGAAVLRER